MKKDEENQHQKIQLSFRYATKEREKSPEREPHAGEISRRSASLEMTTNDGNCPND